MSNKYVYLIHCSTLDSGGIIVFGIFISSGVVEFGPEVTGKDQKTKMLLNDQDKVENGIILNQEILPKPLSLLLSIWVSFSML